MRRGLVHIKRGGAAILLAAMAASVPAAALAAPEAATGATAQPAAAKADDASAKPAKKSEQKVVCRRVETTGSYLSHTRVCRKASKKPAESSPRTASDR